MSEVIRAFIAVLLPGDIRQKVAEVRDNLREISPEVKWVSEDNFHVTLKFLGNVTDDKLDSIMSAVAEAARDLRPFDLEISDVGAFPNSGRPRTVWVDITTGKDALAELARQVDEHCEKIGFPREDRPFRSHITIGRVKDGRGGRELGPALTNSEVGRLGVVRVDSIAVMKSELRREGPIYSVLSEVNLREAEGEQGGNG